MNIVFVILHFNTIEETTKLIESIEDKIDTKSYRIVIVDNASPDQSGETLFQRYINSNVIDVLCLEENIGFARGNNEGISYARQKYAPKFVCCVNNDVLMIQNDFFYCIQKEYSRSKAAVIGPLAYCKDGSIQISAYRLREVSYYRSVLEQYKNGTSTDNYIKAFVKRNFPKLYRILANIKKYYVYPGLKLRKKDRILHGSCLIFTPKFFEVLHGFNTRTFLFREEELLYLSLKKHNLLSVYNPKIKIKHMEDAAIDSIVRNDEEKQAFLAKNEIASLSILIDEMENGIGV